MTKSLNEGAGCVAGGGLELLAQLDGLLHVDLDGEDEVRRGRLGLGHPARDGLLQAREVLRRGLAAAGLLSPETTGGRPLRRLLAARGSGSASGAPPAAAAPRPPVAASPLAAASTSALTIRPPGPVPFSAGELEAHLARHPPRDRRGLDAVAAAVCRSARPSRPRAGARLAAPPRAWPSAGACPRSSSARLRLLGRRAPPRRPRLLGAAPRPRRRLGPSPMPRDRLADRQRVALLGHDRRACRPGRPRRSCWPCPSRSRRARRPRLTSSPSDLAT